MTISEKFPSIDVLKLAQQHCALVAEGSKAWRGNCPVCGRVGGMVVHNGRYYLNCCGDRRGGDGYDLQRVLGLCSDVAHRINPTSAPVPLLAQLAPFDAHVWQPRLTSAQRKLLLDSAGGAYLLGRGLQPATWAAFGLGFTRREDNEAIMIPWFAKGHLIGGRFRLLTPPDKHLRYAWWKGSNTDRLYGSHTHAGRSTLIVCEGEINAMSVWQAVGDRVDVLSTGSENTPIPTNPTWVNRWQRVICWFDKWERATAWATALGGVPVSLPDTDPNDLLQAGEVDLFLQENGV